MHQFRDKSVAQRELVAAGLLFYPVLMAADVLAYRAHEVPVGEDQREHVELMRGVAERFNRRFGEALVVPEVRIPEVGARIRDLQDPTRKMSTTGATEQGTVYVLDEPDAIRKKFKRAVTDSGTEIVRAEDKPGISNLIEILASVRGTTFEAIEREFADARYGDFKVAVGEAVVEHLAPVRERYTALRADEGALEEILAGGAERARALAAETLADVRERMGVGPASVGPARLASGQVSATAVHRLELDLDVFAGPFDLLLSLILREELDLLEVELADVVLAYLDHLEARDELDLEATTEFLVLIAALLELKSRLMLPGEEIEELDELVPGRGGRGAARADAALRPLPRRGGLAAASAPASPRRSSTARRRCPTRCGGSRSSRPRPPTTRRVLGAALGGLLRTPPPVDLSHMAIPRVTLGERLTLLRELLRRGSFAFDDAVRDADRMTVAVTLFALLELYKRGEASWEQAEPFAPITVEAAAA